MDGQIDVIGHAGVGGEGRMRGVSGTIIWDRKVTKEGRAGGREVFV